MITQVGRVSYPHVFEPAIFEGKEIGYEVTLIFDKETEEMTKKLFGTTKGMYGIKELKALVDDELTREFGPDWDKVKGLKYPVKKTSEEGRVDQEGYSEDSHFSRFVSKKYQPGVVDGNAQNSDIINPRDFYAGCYARVEFNPFIFSRTVNKGCSLGLNNIQKVADGEPLGGSRSNAKASFSPVSEKIDITDL